MSLSRWILTFLATPVLTIAGFSAEMKIHFIDVGQGDATLIEFPCAALLVDTGSEKNGKYDGSKALLDYLDTFFDQHDEFDRTLALLAITHPHIDHTRTIPLLLQPGRYNLQNAIMSRRRKGSGGSQQARLRKFVRQRNIPYREIRSKYLDPKGQTDSIIDPINCTETGVDPKIRVLWGRVDKEPTDWGSDAYGRHFADANNHSLVIRVGFGNASILLTGDLEEVAVEDLIEKYRGTGLLNVDIYQTGHHGSHNGTTKPLVTEMTPKIAVISMGPYWRKAPQPDGREYTANAFGHPRKTVVRDLARGVSLRRKAAKKVRVATSPRTFEMLDMEKAVYGTGWDGTVVVSVQSDGWIERPL